MSEFRKIPAAKLFPYFHETSLSSYVIFPLSLFFCQRHTFHIERDREIEREKTQGVEKIRSMTETSRAQSVDPLDKMRQLQKRNGYSRASSLMLPALSLSFSLSPGTR